MKPSNVSDPTETLAIPMTPNANAPRVMNQRGDIAKIIPASEPNVPGALGRLPRPKAVAIASETRGLPPSDRGSSRSDRAELSALLVVVLGVLASGWLIRFVLVRFRFVHHGHGHFVLFHGPVSEVALTAAIAAEGKLRGCFRISRLLTNGASPFHAFCSRFRYRTGTRRDFQAQFGSGNLTYLRRV